MQKPARAFVVAILAFALTLPVLYISSEGAFYLATSASHFPPGSGYRTLYYPLDALGDRWPAIYDARESLIGVWLRLGSDPERRVYIRGNLWPGFYARRLLREFFSDA